MFELVVTPSALDDLRFLKKREQVLILEAMEQQLLNEPLVETRHRKPLRPNSLAAWELRVGLNRIFYDVDNVAEKVFVNAVGYKEHNQLFIRGQEHLL
jgi:mRNA-degrading endonuclease RelE of RelBE toxin-antitoxin system